MDLRTSAGGLFLIAIFGLAALPARADGPAVSAPNGKIEFDAGALSLPTSFVGRFAGTLTLPVGDAFGVQADFSAAHSAGFTGSTALHVFTRDPQSYLIGGTLGAVWRPGESIIAAGPEAELYFGRWTIEAWAGAAMVHPDSGASHNGAFAMGDLAYYPSDNFRVSTGLSLLDGFSALHLGAEYLFGNGALPFALTGDARVGQDRSVLATIGLRLYFGGPPKTLILRHREDDPWDRGGSLFTAVSGPNPQAPAKSSSSSPPVCDLRLELLVDGVCGPWDQGGVVTP